MRLRPMSCTNSDLPLAPETDEEIHSTSQKELPPCFQQAEKGSPLVVPMILGGDIITIAVVLLWLFRWR